VQRELWELIRYRVSMVEERGRAVNRLQKTIEDANLKLKDVVTDIMSKSANALLGALLAGQTDSASLADLARGRLKAKREQLDETQVGTVKPDRRFRLSEQLVMIDTIDDAIEGVSREIERGLQAQAQSFLSGPSPPSRV
jgi:transposase